MRKQFKNTIMELAQRDERIVMILGDVSVYLFDEFKGRYPDRFYNMGICENTLVSMAAGLSAQGLIPFVHSITPFITERSYEQIKLDAAYNRFGMNIVSCGATFDYAWDGATHHCYTDLAILRLLPDIAVLQPGSTKELDVLLRSRYASGETTYYRLSDNPHNIDIPVEYGKGALIKDNAAPLTVMTAGPILGNVAEACRDLNVNLVYFHTIKPIDKEMIARFKDTEILVIHDAYGLKEAICEVPGLRVSTHGIPERYYTGYGTVEDARKTFGLDTTAIRAAVHKKLEDF